MQTIHDAISAHDFEKAKRMLAAEPGQLELQNELGQTPLHRAVWEEQTDIASLFLDAGADVNAIDSSTGNTPLHYAGSVGSPIELAELLLRHGAKLETRNRASETSLLTAAINNPEVAAFLISRGAYFDLNSAVYLGDIDRARELLQEDPQLHRVPKPGLLLDTAIMRRSKEMLKLLLEHGIDPNKGRPPLFSAVESEINRPSQDLEVIQLLLDHRADVRCRSEGMSILTFLHQFPPEGTTKVEALLKRYGAQK
jgi:ankyrin repeat protein